MKDKFKSWKLVFDGISEETLISYIANIIRLNIPNTSYKLSKQCEYYSTLEKLVYDVFNYQITEYLKQDIDEYEVEFWLKPFDTFNTSRFHFDTDDYNQSLGIPVKDSPEPELTMIIYFSDNNKVPTMITDIKDKTLNPDSLKKCSQLILSLPRTFKLVTFNGGKYLHGDCKLTNDKNEDRNILAINIWKADKMPRYIPTYNYELIFYRYCCTFEKELFNDKYLKTDVIFTCKEQGCTRHIENSDIFNNKDMFLSLPSKMDLNLYNPIKDCLEKLNCKCDNFEINKSKSNDNDYEIIITNNNLSIDELIKNDHDLINHFDSLIRVENTKQFSQRFHCQSFYNRDIIQYLILEFNNSYKTDEKDFCIEINSFLNVFKFIIISYSNNITLLLNDAYKPNYDIRLEEGVYVQISCDKRKALKKDVNKHLLTAYILVNSTDKSNNCKFWFEEDNMIYDLKPGDLFICKSSNRFYILPFEGKTQWIILYLDMKKDF